LEAGDVARIADALVGVRLTTPKGRLSGGTMAGANGVTVDEIKEILVHATVYCGTPAGRQAFLAARDALQAAGALPLNEKPDPD
jgi:Carboxymuconolactone decarboxylase family